MPWTLTFPFDTVDARIEAREFLHLLRADPFVTDVHLTQARGAHAQVDVVFVEGHEEPADRALAERLRPFLPRAPERSQVMVEGFRRNYGLDRPNENGDHFTPELRQQIINQYINTAEGRTRLGATFANPLRARMDYMSISRRTFMVDQLPDGALPIYDRDVPVADIVTAESTPVILPYWVQIGSFARLKVDHSRVVAIVSIQRPPEGSAAPVYIGVQAWRVLPPAGHDVIRSTFFEALWEPCNQPPDPRPLWERLLDEDLF